MFFKVAYIVSKMTRILQTASDWNIEQSQQHGPLTHVDIWQSSFQVSIK